MKQHWIWQSTLENRSDSPVLTTAPWFSAGVLAVHRGTKTQSLKYTMLLRRWRGTCNFEASWYLHRASTIIPLLGLSRGNAQTPGARSTDGRNTHRNVFKSPPSTMLEILSPDREAESSENGIIPPTAYHCYCESLTVLHRSTARFKHAQTSATNCEQYTVSTWLQGSKTALLVMLSQIAADFLRVKCGLLTKSCKGSETPSISSSQIITRFGLMMNFSAEVTGTRTMRAVSWNTWKKTGRFFYDANDHKAFPHWTPFILWRAAGVHENQPAKSKTIWRQLRQGGSSLKTAPALVALGQRTGTHPDKPPSHRLWTTLFQKPIQQKTDWNEQLRWTAQSSWFLSELYWCLVGALSSNINPQAYWELPIPASQTKTLHRQLEENSSDFRAHIVPAAPQEATNILA